MFENSALQAFLQALCLVLILEGMVPFLNPRRWRMLVAKLAMISDRQLRVMGLISMLIGAGLLFWLRH